MWFQQLRMQFFPGIYVVFTQMITMLCTCAGIVRGVDVQKGLLYVITPVPLERLQSVDLLQQGLIEIPTSLLQVTFFSLVIGLVFYIGVAQDSLSRGF
jgi:ABC-type multidrug transport system permease subunit